MFTPKSSIANSISRVRSLFAGTLFVATILFLLNAPANAQNPNQDRIRAVNASSKCWHKQYDHTDNGNIIHIWDCDAGITGNKAFYYEPSTGYIRSSVTPSKCIHKQSEGWINGDRIHLWDCTGGTAENKTFSLDAQTGRVRFRANPSFCAQGRDQGYTNGNPLVVGACSSAESYTVARAQSPPPRVQAQDANVNRNPQNVCFLIKTADDTGAGTDSSVYMILKGDGKTEEVYLSDKTDQSNAFERGQTDRVCFNTLIYNIENIWLKTDGKYAGPAWHIEWIQRDQGSRVRLDIWLEGAGVTTTAIKP